MRCEHAEECEKVRAYCFSSDIEKVPECHCLDIDSISFEDLVADYIYSDCPA